jgi:hypothetical protein
MQSGQKVDCRAGRRSFIGGSDARIIMGGDEAALARLWQEKRGEADPEDLSANLIVQLGTVTEELNRTWYARNTGHRIGDVQRRVQHSAIPWMVATLDGIVEGTQAVFEAKFMLPWSFSEEAAAEKYMAQVQHNMWVAHLRSAVLSIITGGGKWVEITIPMDPLYLSVLVSAEKKFWRCVQSGEPPHLINAEPPRPRIEAIRIADMSSSNSWAEFAALFRGTRQASSTTSERKPSQVLNARGRQGGDRPQRMGAALTYARRYALFTLVGIAGEDDLDAPDLCEEAPSAPPSVANRVLKPLPDQSRGPFRKSGNGRDRGTTKGETPAIIDGEQSAALRERLLAEIGKIASTELAASWAREALAAKNKLAAPDAKLVEDSFEQRLLELASAGTNPSGDDAPANAGADPQETSTIAGTDPDRSAGIDKSVLAVAAPRRYRNREHLRSVAKQPCLICGRKPSDPHHLRYLQLRALGRKASDEFGVPLCRVHHRAVHRARDEQAWWQAAGIDPIKVARKLWKDTRIDEGRVEPDRTPTAATADRTTKAGGDVAEPQAPA